MDDYLRRQRPEKRLVAATVGGIVASEVVAQAPAELVRQGMDPSCAQGVRQLPVSQSPYRLLGAKLTDNAEHDAAADAALGRELINGLHSAP